MRAICGTRDWPFPNGGNGKDQGARRYAKAVIRNSSRRCVTVSLSGWARDGEATYGARDSNDGRDMCVSCSDMISNADRRWSVDHRS